MIIVRGMNDRHETIAAPVAKATTAWAAVGITSWSTFSSFLAAIYSLLLILEWCWKRFLRDQFVKRGWWK